MGLVVPKVRTHLCADALLRSVQDVFCQLPEHRKGDSEIPLRDALMSAFALVSLGIVSKPVQKLVGRLTLFQDISQVLSYRKTV